LSGQTERTFAATGRCGIPTTAKSLAANVTVVAPAYGGTLRAYPSGLSFVPSIISNAFNAGNVRAVQGHVSIDGSGADAGKLRLFANVPSASTAHAIVDLFGYFAPNPSAPLPAGNSWFVTLRDEGSRLLTEYRYDWRTDLGTSVTSLLKDYVYLGNLLVATNTTTSSDGKPLGWVYQSSDHLGSPRMWTDTSRVTLASFRFRAFGLPMNTLQTPGQGFDFAGMEKDVSSGHHYDHARFYGSWISRFTSPDKVGGILDDPASFNRYAYARNNPLLFVDPDGRAVKVATETKLLIREAAAKGILDSGVPGREIVAGVTEMSLAGTNPISLGEINASANSLPMPFGMAIGESVLLGKEGEQLARIVGPKLRIESFTQTAKYRIPDALNTLTRALTEVKNAAYLRLSGQLRDFLLFAESKGYKFTLVVRQNTVLSKELKELVDAGRVFLKTLPQMTP
jgi:RHS repeat-associated protein